MSTRAHTVAAATAAVTATARDPRWAEVVARDARADGRYFYSVRTTGVYCRPSCASRAARPEHVAFHATADAAERAGFRACKRCRPDAPPAHEQRAALVAALCRVIEAHEGVPTLAELAAHAGRSTFHTLRMFKAVTGVTPAAYARAQRVARAARSRLGGASVTTAIYAAGYGSSSRFYERDAARLGVAPARARRGAPVETLRFAVGAGALGAVLVAASARGVCAILLGDDPAALAQDLVRRFPRAELVGGDAAFEALVARVIALVDDPRAGHTLPLDIRGTAFQQRVWRALARVAPGTTTTYAQLAQAIGAPRGARAVAQALAANPLAVAVPCHRVVREGGELSGYRWGVARKRALLARERAPVAARARTP